MHHERLLRTCLACTVIVSVWAAAPGGQYSITVNRDRLVNAQNEPQNWLLMNGDYGSQRYSKLTQIQSRQRPGICGSCGRWRSGACRTPAATAPRAS